MTGTVLSWRFCLYSVAKEYDEMLLEHDQQMVKLFYDSLSLQGNFFKCDFKLLVL